MKVMASQGVELYFMVLVVFWNTSALVEGIQLDKANNYAMKVFYLPKQVQPFMAFFILGKA